MERSLTIRLDVEDSPSARSTRSSGRELRENFHGGNSPGSTVDLSSPPAPSNVSRLGRIQSAPMLPAANSTQGSTWYTGGVSSHANTTRQSCWKPLGSTWRDWETDGQTRVRTQADDGSEFVQGCVPHWGKGATIRMKGVIEHELTWAYYRMRRHVQHPLRKETGDSKFGEFKFWRDLKPPFHVLSVNRIDEQASGSVAPHADGDLYNVTYECGIDYASERAQDLFGEGGTFDNRIHGDALVRFSNSFPQKRPLRIVSWGKPMLNWTPGDDDADRPSAVDPSTWMPIAEVLGVRADAPQLSTCRALMREATRKKQAKDKRGVDVPELERLLLGPHASLPRLAAATQNVVQNAGARPQVSGSPSPQVRRRSHTIYTSAAGFVRYAG